MFNVNSIACNVNQVPSPLAECLDTTEQYPASLGALHKQSNSSDVQFQISALPKQKQSSATILILLLLVFVRVMGHQLPSDYAPPW